MILLRRFLGMSKAPKGWDHCAASKNGFSDESSISWLEALSATPGMRPQPGLMIMIVAKSPTSLRNSLVSHNFSDLRQSNWKDNPNLVTRLLENI